MDISLYQVQVVTGSECLPGLANMAFAAPAMEPARAIWGRGNSGRGDMILREIE